MGGRGKWRTEGEKDDNIFPAEISQLMHIFRNAPGHFKKDTASNRKLITETVNDAGSFKGADIHNKNWYAKTLPSGQEVWVAVKNGKIANAGINETPKPNWQKYIESARRK
jgi:hypothetical protein